MLRQGPCASEAPRIYITDFITAMAVETLSATDADSAANGLGTTAYSFEGIYVEVYLNINIYFCIHAELFLLHACNFARALTITGRAA